MATVVRHKWVIVVVALVLLVLLLALMSWLRPGVPKSVVIVAGMEGSGTHDWAERYAEYARDRGLRAEVVATAGSGEVLERLEGLTGREKRRTLGFLQSGAEEGAETGPGVDDLQSLGSVYFEPIWVIVRTIRDFPWNKMPTSLPRTHTGFHGSRGLPHAP